MTAKEVRNYLAEVCSHITFTYKGKAGGIDPLAVDKYDVWYGEKVLTLESIDEVMEGKLFDGKSVNEIADLVEFDFSQ